MFYTHESAGSVVKGINGAVFIPILVLAVAPINGYAFFFFLLSKDLQQLCFLSNCILRDAGSLAFP